MSASVGLPAHTEFGIVGGGIIGLSVAYELTRRGRRVVVLDDGSRAGVATHAAAGMIAPAAESEMEHSELVELRRLSHALYPEFVQHVEADSGVDCAFRTDGTLVVALDRDHAVEIERLREIVTDQGFETHALSAREVLEIEPNVSGRVVQGLRLPQDFHVDQRSLVRALRVALARTGALLASDVVVERVERNGTITGSRRDAPTPERFEIHCDQVVVSAGSWTPVELELPFAPLPVRPVRGQVVRLHAAAALRHVVRTPDVYLVPHAAGELIVGASVEEQGFDARPTAGAVLDLLRHAWRALPVLYDAPLTEIAVGFRPTARDHLPIFGRWSSRIAVATGHFRNGILLAPGTARLLAQLLCDGVEHQLLRVFAPQRFSERGAGGARDPRGESCIEST